jgi:hypothetical protein
MSVFSSLLGDGQRANELTYWEPRKMFSVRSARRLYDTTLVIFGSQFRRRMVRVIVQDGEIRAAVARELKLGVQKKTRGQPVKH